MNNKKEKAVYALADILVREIVKEIQNERHKTDSQLSSPEPFKTDVSSENLNHTAQKRSDKI
jgi:hypothetical protein